MYWGRHPLSCYAQGFPELMQSCFYTLSQGSFRARRIWQEAQAQSQAEQCRKGMPLGTVSAQPFLCSQSSERAGTREERKAFALVIKTCSSIFPQAPAKPKINCRPGSWPLAWDYICILLQRGRQAGGLHSRGLVGNALPTMESLPKLPGWGKRTNGTGKCHSSKKCTLLIRPRKMLT